MAGEPLHIFDPRCNFQTQGFTGRAATTTMHDATETGVSISGIFQAAEDFAVLGWWNAYDYFNHLRCKHLPRTDLSGLKLEFDIEYDQTLDGAMRFDAAKYPSVSWDAMTFVTGKGDIHDVRLLDHATVISGIETPARASLGISGAAPKWGTDVLHLHFRDTRYTVEATHVGSETQLAADVTSATGPQWVVMGDVSEFAAGDMVIIERLGANEEICRVQGVDAAMSALLLAITINHPVDSFASLVNTRARVGQQLALIVNTPGDTVSGRFGPDQTSVIQTAATDTGILISFVTPEPPAGNYGKLGNMDSLLLTAGHIPLGEPYPNGYDPADDVRGFSWDAATAAFTGGDCDKKYHITFDFTEPLMDKNGNVVPMSDCRKMYMVFAPRFAPADASDMEWGCTISNIQVTGDGSLKVGGGAARIEEADAGCKYTGYWENYKYGADPAWPSQWWSTGHARRTAPTSTGDLRKVALRYSQTEQHDLYLGTFLNVDCGTVAVTLDGDAPTSHDLYLSEYGGTTANVKVRGGVAAGTHIVEITALFDKNSASSGYYFYFDYLWPLVPQDVPDAPKIYGDVSLAIDFDTDHGYKKPPAWHLWQLQKLGFNGPADVYMGVFWNNKRRRVDATYPYATIEFSGDPAPGDVVSFSIGGTTVNHAIGYGETLQQIVSHLRATINGMFSGVWAEENGTTLRIQSKAPSWTFPGLAVSAPNSVTLALDDHMSEPGAEGDWKMLDSVSPVMTEGTRRWIRDLAGQFAAAGIQASFAFSMECYRPPADMAARYWDGSPVDLSVPSTQMHFGSRVRTYLKQMYKECADEIAASGLAVVLQFGETQWWYFSNESGMPYYDAETKADFEAAHGRPMHRFLANTDDPNDDIETADFLRDRIWAYCQDVISYVRQYHPTAVFECLWPLDANQGEPKPSPGYRALNMHVNLPSQWKNSSYGIKYFRCEGFDYDVWQKNSTLMRQVIAFAKSVLGRPAEECMFLSGLYGPPDPPMAQAYGMWLPLKLYSFCFWAFDQFCLNSRPVPLPIGALQVSNAQYFKPKAARAIESVVAQPLVLAAGGALNQFRANTRGFKSNE